MTKSTKAAKTKVAKTKTVKKDAKAQVKKPAKSAAKDAAKVKKTKAAKPAAKKAAPARAAAKPAVKSAKAPAAVKASIANSKPAVKASANPAAAPLNAKGSAVYDESKIKTLSSLEHIRLRTGMYIGRLGDGSNPDDGIYVLLKEIIDNGIDEFIMGNGKQLDIIVKDGTAKVRDFGRGIPLGKLVECVSVINTGAKYNDDVFQFSVGLNGVGTKAVNALSSNFRVVAIRDGEYAEAVFSRGELKSERKGKLSSVKGGEKQKNGTYVEFTPDRDVFGDYEFNPEFIERRILNYAYLNTGLTLTLNGKSYLSKRGLFDLLTEECGDDPLYPLGYYKGVQSEKGHLEFAFSHTNNYGEEYFSFVNGQFTSDGGSHLSAFK